MSFLTRKILLNVFLVLSLAGVQVLAHSPLHSHASHSAVDCGLCHAASSAPIPSPAPAAPAFSRVKSIYHATVRQFNASLPYPPFLSRAPPAVLLQKYA